MFSLKLQKVYQGWTSYTPKTKQKKINSMINDSFCGDHFGLLHGANIITMHMDMKSPKIKK